MWDSLNIRKEEKESMAFAESWPYLIIYDFVHLFQIISIEIADWEIENSIVDTYEK